MVVIITLIALVIVSLFSDKSFIVVSKSIVLLKSTPKIDDNKTPALIINLSLYLDIDILFFEVNLCNYF